MVWQELQAVVLMLCRVAFHLAGYNVALNLDNSMAKTLLCYIGHTAFLVFPDWPVA